MAHVSLLLICFVSVVSCWFLPELITCNEKQLLSRENVTVVQVTHVSNGVKRLVEAHGGWNSIYMLGPLYNSLTFPRQGVGYRLVRPSPDLAQTNLYHPTFHKIFVLKEVLRNAKPYDTIVLMDMDAMVTHPNQSLICLLNHWGWFDEQNRQTLWMMAPEDPNLPNNKFKDINNVTRVQVNTGFIITRKVRATDEGMDKWAEALVVQKEWHHKWAHEQTVFHIFIRPGFEKLRAFKALPCSEANGWGWYAGSKDQNFEGQSQCMGRYVSHFWSNKGGAAEEYKRRLIELMWHHEIETMPTLVYGSNYSLTPST